METMSQDYAERMNEKDEEIDFVRDQAKKQITFIMKQ